MQVTAVKKKTSPLVWVIVILMVLALISLIIFYAYQDYPSEKLPSDDKGSSLKIIYIHET